MLFKRKTPLHIVLCTITPCTSDVCEETILNRFVTCDSVTAFGEVITTLQSTNETLAFVANEHKW
jgi:hypothetical protein